MHLFLRNGSPGPLRENNGPLKSRLCQSQVRHFTGSDACHIIKPD
jgi:hypothetical protein